MLPAPAATWLLTQRAAPVAICTIPAACRERGQEVCRLLREGDPSGALELLLDDPKLAFVRDEHSGGFPAHVAAFKVRALAASAHACTPHPRRACALACARPLPPPSPRQGYEGASQYLASLAGVLEQRDGRRETPLGVALRYRQAAVAQVLREAGARDEGASFAPEALTTARWDEGGEEGDAGGYMSWGNKERQSYKRGGKSTAWRARGASGRGREQLGVDDSGSGDARCPW